MDPQADLYRQTCTDWQVMAVLLWLSCPSCPFGAVLSFMSCSCNYCLLGLWPVQAYSTYLSVRPLQTDLFWMYCPTYMSNPGCPVMAALLCLSCVDHPFPAIPVLSMRSWSTVVLSYLSSPQHSCPPAFPSPLSSLCFQVLTVLSNCHVLAAILAILSSLPVQSELSGWLFRPTCPGRHAPAVLSSTVKHKNEKSMTFLWLRFCENFLFSRWPKGLQTTCRRIFQWVFSKLRNLYSMSAMCSGFINAN